MQAHLSHRQTYGQADALPEGQAGYTCQEWVPGRQGSFQEEVWSAAAAQRYRRAQMPTQRAKEMPVRLHRGMVERTDNERQRLQDYSRTHPDLLRGEVSDRGRVAELLPANV